MEQTQNPSGTAATCTKCGTTIVGETTGGLCPRCLLEMNLASRTMPGGEASPQIPTPSPGEIAGSFPQFEIVECLGRGGMGVVYKARQKSLDRWVAIKLLAPERVHDERFAEHFEREAKTLARLSHPNIVTVFDHGEADGLFYIVMEFVDGVNLRDLLMDGKMEPAQALAIVPEICAALQFAHDHGVVHRDIKPENILIDRDGRVKIADFGIAALVGTDADRSGTPPYMAPEQETAGGTIDHRADIYALGVVLYEMLTGERPDQDLPRPSQRVEIDVRLDEIVLRALEKTPNLRYQTAGEFRTMLEAMVETTLTTPPSSAKVQHGAEREERYDPSPPRSTFTDAEGASQARISPLYHRPRSLRECWPWDANFLSRVTAILASFPVILALCLMPVFGAKSLLFLILELIPLLYVVVYFSILKRIDRLRAKVTPDAREIAEGLFATRVMQTPCLAILADDRLELLGLADQPIIIPLIDIEKVTVIRWFNGRRLWWKGCLKIERRSAPAIAIALAECVSSRWKPYLTGEVKQLELIPPKDGVAANPITRVSDYVALVAFLCAYIGFLIVLASTAGQLPVQVASHFGAEGQPNGWMSRSTYLVFLGAMPLLFGGMAILISWLTQHLPARFINIPRRDFWLTPERRPETAAFLRQRMFWLSVLMTLFFAGLHLLTVHANRLTPARLSLDGLLPLIIVFLLAMIIWIVSLLMRLAEVEKPLPKPPSVLEQKSPTGGGLIEQNELDTLSRDRRNWHAFLFYRCADDPRIVVPKRVLDSAGRSISPTLGRFLSCSL
jgi:serine/threonine protein kinase